jgi:hypothetical protein
MASHPGDFWLLRVSEGIAGQCTRVQMRFSLTAARWIAADRLCRSYLLADAAALLLPAR